jgi:hypothetical protein
MSSLGKLSQYINNTSCQTLSSNLLHVFFTDAAYAWLTHLVGKTVVWLENVRPLFSDVYIGFEKLL